MSSISQANLELATRIADRLFRVATGAKARRLVLMTEEGCGIGGWSEELLAMQIAAVLQTAEITPAASMRQRAAQLCRDRQKFHDENCRAECKCSDGFHLAQAISELPL